MDTADVRRFAPRCVDCGKTWNAAQSEDAYRHVYLEGCPLNPRRRTARKVPA